MRINSRHIKQYVQATSKSVFIKHDDEKRLNRLSIGWTNRTEDALYRNGENAYITNCVFEWTVLGRKPRWFIMRYLLTTVDGKQPSYVRFHAYIRLYVYVYSIFFYVQRSFAFAEWWIKIDFFLYFMNVYMFIFINEIENRDLYYTVH